MASWSGAAKGAGIGVIGGPIGMAAGGVLGGLFWDDTVGDIDIGDPLSAGQNRYKNNPAPYDQVYYGGAPGMAGDIAAMGLDRSKQTGFMGDEYGALSLTNRGPQAYEDPTLSGNEAFTRGYDQSGALQLGREAAMGNDPSLGLLASAAYGNEPSEAAYMLQSGLDQSIANQAAMAGGARGNAGIALAGGNQAANVAAMQGQAYNQAGQLRAEEMGAARGAYAGAMSQARGDYANMANTVRAQDQSRLGMGNQTAQFNAGLNDQFNMGMGNLANQTNAQGLGWYNGAQVPLAHDANLGRDYQMGRADNYNRFADRGAGIAQANADARARDRDAYLNASGQLITVVGNAAKAGA